MTRSQRPSQLEASQRTSRHHPLRARHGQRRARRYDIRQTVRQPRGWVAIAERKLRECAMQPQAQRRGNAAQCSADARTASQHARVALSCAALPRVPHSQRTRNGPAPVAFATDAAAEALTGALGALPLAGALVNALAGGGGMGGGCTEALSDHALNIAFSEAEEATAQRRGDPRDDGSSGSGASLSDAAAPLPAKHSRQARGHTRQVGGAIAARMAHRVQRQRRRCSAPGHAGQTSRCRGAAGRRAARQAPPPFQGLFQGR